MLKPYQLLLKIELKNSAYCLIETKKELRQYLKSNGEKATPLDCLKLPRSERLTLRAALTAYHWRDYLSLIKLDVLYHCSSLTFRSSHQGLKVVKTIRYLCSCALLYKVLLQCVLFDIVNFFIVCNKTECRVHTVVVYLKISLFKKQSL